MGSDLKFPIAYEKGSNRLVNAKDVPNGLDCNCYCFHCKQDLVAVNREIKQKAHFRHYNHTNVHCGMNYETFVHKVTKEIFGSLKTFMVPPITLADFDLDNRRAFAKEAEKLLSDAGVSLRVDDEDGDLGSSKNIITADLILQGTSEVRIGKYEIQKTYKSKFGNVIPDIVIVHGNSKLFIEPYVTSEIDDTKLQKLTDLDISTITIDLKPLINKHKFDFTIEELQHFLEVGLHFKHWAYISRAKKDKLSQKWINEILPGCISACKEILKHNYVTQQVIDKCYLEICSLSNRIEKLNREIESQRNQLKDINLSEILKMSSQ